MLLVLATAALAVGLSAADLPYTDVFGSPGEQCSGAQMVATGSALLVWGICAPNGQYPSRNLTIWLRASTDWGKSWQPRRIQPFPPPSLPKIAYDTASGALVSMGYCEPGPGERAADISGCPLPASCSWRSTDLGASWTGPVHAGAYGSGEGCVGAALADGVLLMPTGLPNCTTPSEPSADHVLISSDHGSSWQLGGPTPRLASGQSWGECAVAELANGSVVLTSRLASTLGRHTAPVQRAFAISHDRAATWANAWTFAADLPFGSGFGPGYNVEHGLISADKKSKLLLSKPTANLRGDASGRSNCTRGTQGSCTYRRNLTVAHSADGGTSWAIDAWGLVYADRVAYSAMAELPSGEVAVVFERGNPSEEYRYLSVAIVTPDWA